MASMLSVEQFQCCICLDIFTDPVSIPCGHNLCLGCIKGYWDMRCTAECPLCKETFKNRPELRINRGLADITEHFRRSLKGKPHRGEDVNTVVSPGTEKCSSGQRIGADEVPCDICHGNKLTAVKSCLVCQASYCENHLIPHQRETALKGHRVTDPATFTIRNLCRKHNKRLEMFCKKDQTPLCITCIYRDHKDHKPVPMEEESKRIKSQLKKTETEFQQMIKSRLRKMEEIKHSLELSKKSTEREIEGSIQVFSMLISAIERHQAGLIEEIKEKQKAAERRAEGLLNQLEQEISELQRRSSELKHLEHTENHLHLLQSFPFLSTPPSSKDWSEVSVHSNTSVGTVRRTVSKLVGICQELEKKLSVEEVTRTNQYAVDVTLDPVTAAAWLVLSPDRKQVRLSYQQNKVPVPADPRRFDSCVCVLGKQSFSTGRRYWVVQVGDKTDWDLGVARESINRKGSITVRPDSGYWAICRRKGGSLSACAGPSVSLHLRDNPQKVGVFLDYEEGVVSFYDEKAKTHIYTYSGCVFTEALYPYLNPCVHDNGKNIAPLVICPVEGGVM
ncbi:E3 ubiquitin-protein ligase TRIM39-like [Centroberyx affinis]|uniref:E3 ubiquitin-protein ligase TRIM39-like n=1 Tax=Centroberyx affinis TaxID=166261 RepID=UPI003A5BF761